MKKLLTTIIGLTLALTTSGVSAKPDFSGVELTGSSGGVGGGYETKMNKFLSYVKSLSDGQIKTFNLNSGGSIENIDRFNDSDVNQNYAFISQADTLNVKKLTYEFSSRTLGREPVQWVYNKNHGKDDLEDIEGSTEWRIVMVEGSGSESTLKSFVLEDSGYTDTLNSIIYVEDQYEAFDIASQGKIVRDGVTYKIAGTIYVGTRIPAEVAEDFGGELMVGSLTDGDFNDAVDTNEEKLYTNCTVKEYNTSGIKTKGWGDPDTVCVATQLIFKKSENKALNKLFNKATVKTKKFFDN